ncbi:MAG: cupin domain-containing protein [Clostridia bacterium]
MKIFGNILSLFESIEEYWSPRIIAEVNNDYIKIAKIKGEIVGHDHENEDEMFYVLKGGFDLHLEEEIIHLNEGDFYVVKKGIKHKPVADKECWIMLIETKETKHTGRIKTELTKTVEDQLRY